MIGVFFTGLSLPQIGLNRFELSRGPGWAGFGVVVGGSGGLPLPQKARFQVVADCHYLAGR